MNILVDVHTHTIASGHAYSTITENMQAASRKHLKMIAMTDHTPGMPGSTHPFHFDNLKAIPDEMFGVRLLRGAETNIINYEGDVVLAEQTLRGLDLVLASLHPPCIEFADEETVTSGLEKVMENKEIYTSKENNEVALPITQNDNNERRYLFTLQAYFSK